MSLVVPAVLPHSKKELEKNLEIFSAIPSVHRIQIDVVDGRFAEPASWPYTAPKEFKEMIERKEMLPHLHQIEYEVDLMCIDAEQIIAPWLEVGASRFTFHAESVLDLHRIFASVQKRYNSKGFAPLISFGIALNVASDIALIEPHIKDISYVQFMGISRIGRQGQPFDKRTLDKIRFFHKKHPKIPIQVDGGVSVYVANKLIDVGASNLVIGSALTRGGNPSDAIAEFEKILI